MSSPASWGLLPLDCTSSNETYSLYRIEIPPSFLDTLVHSFPSFLPALNFYLVSDFQSYLPIRDGRIYYMLPTVDILQSQEAIFSTSFSQWITWGFPSFDEISHRLLIEVQSQDWDKLGAVYFSGTVVPAKSSSLYIWWDKRWPKWATT